MRWITPRLAGRFSHTVTVWQTGATDSFGVVTYTRLQLDKVCLDQSRTGGAESMTGVQRSGSGATIFFVDGISEGKVVSLRVGNKVADGASRADVPPDDCLEISQIQCFEDRHGVGHHWEISCV